MDQPLLVGVCIYFGGQFDSSLQNYATHLLTYIKHKRDMLEYENGKRASLAVEWGKASLPSSALRVKE